MQQNIILFFPGTFGISIATESAQDPLFSLSILGILLIVFLVAIATMWKVFTKARQRGWAIFIPFYSAWVYAKIAGKPGWLGLLPLLSIPIGILVTALLTPLTVGLNTDYFEPSSGVLPGSTFALIIGMSIAGLFTIITTLPLALGVARQFGQGTLFGFVFLYLIPLGYLYLAFGYTWHEATRNTDDEDMPNLQTHNNAVSIYPDAPDSLRR